MRFLFERQQLADGSFPRNSLINGKLAPDSFGIQLDEVAYPILMARTVGLDEPTSTPTRSAPLRTSSSPTARRSGPSGGRSRAAVAVDDRGRDRRAHGRRAIADLNGDTAGARIYRATADHYQRYIKGWTSQNGPLSADPYFIRLSKNGDPERGDHLQPRQRRA